MYIDSFVNRYKGETALLVGNGENLHLTPPTNFSYPSFGMNTIFKYESWRPDYYVTVDQRVMREFGDEVAQLDMPKFVPTPHLNDWQMDNTYRFNHLAHELWDEHILWNLHALKFGFAYHSVMHATMQIAALMGFTTLLMIGVEHNPEDGRRHFWGTDIKMPMELPLNDWLRGYKVLVEGMKRYKVTVLNISENTYVADSILPRGDWRNYVN